jgi:hypothetical protein
MQTASMPTAWPLTNATDDELLTQPTTYRNGPASDLLTTQEAANGCRLYEVPDSSLAPALWKGDYVVAQPLTVDQWAAITPGTHCVVLQLFNGPLDGPAVEGFPEFKAHQLLRVVSNGLRYGGELLVVANTEDHEYNGWEPVEAPIQGEEIVEAYRIIRSIRLL